MFEEALSVRTTDFVSELRRQGVTLWLDGEQLRVRAPQSTLSSSLRSVLAERKAELVEFLRARQEELVVTSDPKSRFLPFALTELQQSYWLGQTDAFELGNVNPHVYGELEFSGIELERVRTVINRLIERHDMLRSVVLPTGEQVVLERAPDWEFPCTDLSGLDEQTRSRELTRVRDEMSRDFKSTEAWPPFEILAHLIPDGKLRLHVSISLLAIDGTSLRIIAEEARALYREPHKKLPTPSLTFREYVTAALAFRETVAYQLQEQYWRERVADMPPAPELPLVRAPASIVRPVLKRRSARLDAETWARFQKSAGGIGVFRTAALCAAYCAILGRWSKKPSFTLNILDSQRAALQDLVNSVVGNFSATTLTAVNARSDLTFAELAHQVNARRMLDRKNGAVSGVWTLRELNRLRGAAAQASMPVVFNSLDSVLEGDEDIFSNEVVGSLQTPQMMLDHMVVARGRGLELHWDALEEVFPDGLLDSMFEAYQQLIARLSSDGAAWQLPLHQLIKVPATPRLASAPPPRHLRLCDDIWKRAEERPDAIAVVDGRRTLTYRELLAEVATLARRLHEGKAERGGLVAVVMNKGWEQIVAVLAIHEAGAAYLPIDAQLPNERICQILDRGKVRLALTQPWLQQQVALPASVKCFAVATCDVTCDATFPVRMELHTEPSDLAYVIFTSGSTGEPKGVMIDHVGALNTIDDINSRLGVKATDRTLCVSSLGFDLSVYDVFGLLAAGGTVVVPGSEDARDPERLATWLCTQGITIWNSVPATMEMLVEHLESRDERLPPSLRVVMLSGDWIPVTLPDRVRRLGQDVQVLSLGGATEASIWSIAYPIGRVDPDWKSIPYGAPLANQNVYVLDDALEPCPTWVPGELYIAGIGLALGYFGDPEQTAARFIYHPRSGERLYRTGDWGRYLADGAIEFLGRDDLQVKVQGFRIELGEIETVLARHEGVRAAVVSVTNASANGRQLAAYVVPKREGLTAADVRAFLSERLPVYMVPTSVKLLTELPLTANGKVDRNRLGTLEIGHTSRGGAPSSPRERELARLWEAVLQRQDIALEDNFFELGGNSLSAVRLSALIEQKLGCRIAVSQLLRAPTICGMNALLGSVPVATPPCLVQLRERTARPPLILVHPVGGNVFCYRQLAELLAEYSVYGIQASEDDDETTIEEMARRYLTEVKGARLTGPWLIGGWSMGGIVAAEMAVQLAACGERVEAVVMFDSLLPSLQRELDGPWLVERFLADLGAPPDLCRSAYEWASSAGGPNQALERALPELDAGSVGIERLTTVFGVFARNQRALRRYAPKALPAPALLVRARVGVFDGWRDPTPWLCAEGARVSELTVDASHFTLLTEPTLGLVAQAVTAFLTQNSLGVEVSSAQEPST